METKQPDAWQNFLWHAVTSLLGAFNDNVFRWLIVGFLIARQGAESATTVMATGGLVFVVPFLLFSAFAGCLADRISKRTIIVFTKLMEIAVMLLGVLAFLSDSPVCVYGVLFLMATQSAFFGPSKYGIIPELVGRERLSRANGLMEMLTYMAIIVGTVLGLWLSKVSITGHQYAMVTIVCVLTAGLGTIASLRIHRTPPAGGTGKSSLLFYRDIYRTVKAIADDRYLLLSVLAGAFFVFVGAFIQSNIVAFGMENLGLSTEGSGLLFLVAAVGIGAGALLAGKLSGRGVEIGLVPIGAVGLAASLGALGFFAGNFAAVCVLLFILGLSGGLFVVPIHAFIQYQSPKQQLGEILAASNFLGWVGALLAFGLIYIFANFLSMSAAQIFVVLGLITVVLAAVTVKILPYFLVRGICVLLTRLCYRIKVRGEQNVPTEGGVLIVCNHASWIDPLVLGVTQQRRIRFIMYRGIFDTPWFNWLFRLLEVIPISAEDPPKKILRSLKEARAAMDAGDIVCIFAEGAITRTGMLGAFKGGFERIVKNSDYKIIPAYIGGAWGSIFSHYYGRLLSTLPKRFRYPVSVHFGEPMAGNSTTDRIREKVLELSSDYFSDMKPKRRSLADTFVRTARKNWRRRCINDTIGRRYSYGQALVSSIALAGEIEKLAPDEKRIGIILPPSTGGALANLAVSMLGKVSVNLSYVLSEQARNMTIAESDLKCILSSRKFLDKAKVSSDLPGLVFIEDLAAKITPWAKVKAYASACCMPRKILTRSRDFTADDVATIIFSSGSSGKPKGIMLSHHNILSNIEAVRMVIKIYPNDNLCGVLPFFHSFGYTITFWLPLIVGVSVSYVPNPLDGRLVSETIHKNASTLLFATPTFLQGYIRRGKPSDFSTLRLVVAGAEKLKDRLADAFEDRFDIRPLEGYGATELTPLVSLNVPDVEIGGAAQVGQKPGTIGHPIPGIAVRIVDPETDRSLPVGDEGLLKVKGPNVMLGYLNNPEATADVLDNGWYNTGDIATMDSDGFLRITDRLARFSKIGGEMVGHLAVEELCLKGLDTHNRAVAVTSIPDEKKGEELAILYVKDAADADELYQIVSDSDLPNICKPRRENYIPVDALPILGSGKLDIMKLRKTALAAKSGDNGNE